MEEWKVIEEFGEGKYKISNLGNVINTDTNHILSTDINSSGYHRVQLYHNKERKKFFRHRLVAQYFIPNPNNLPFINHIDGNKSHNYYSNLEWCSQSDNEKHAFKNNLKKKTNKPIKVMLKDNSELLFQNQCECAEYFKVSQSAVSSWLTGVNNPRENKGIQSINFIKA